MGEGIGAGFVPDILNTQIYDEIIRVRNEDTNALARRISHPIFYYGSIG